MSSPETIVVRARANQLAKSLFSIALLGVCVAVSDINKLPDALQSVDAWAVVGAFLLNVSGSVVVPALMTRSVMGPARLSLSVFELIMINFAMRFYVLVLPRAASTALRWYRYKQRGTGSDALALMILVGLFQFLIMTAFSALFIGMESSLLGRHSNWLIPVALSGMAFSTLALLPFFSTRSANFLSNLSSSSPSFMPGMLRAKLSKLWVAVQAYHALSPAVLVRILMLSILSYVLFVGSAYVVALSMSLNVSLAAIAWVRSVVFLLTLVPVTVGGLGVREVGTVAFLNLYGVPQHDAFAFSLVMLAVQLLIGLVGLAYEGVTHVRAVLGARTKVRESTPPRDGLG